MSINYNGASATDGLVFAYDLGNVRSYKGEPTVNQYVNPDFSDGVTGWSFGSWDGNISRTTETVVGPYGKDVSALKLTKNAYSSYSHFHQGNNGKYTTGTTYSLSAWVKGSGILRGRSQWGDNINFTLTGNWQYVEYTVTSPNSYNYPYWAAELITEGTTLYMTYAQSEAKPYVTPYVKGERTATEGLLDIIGGASIDLTNVSFDSNAQMIFDGTDEILQLPKIITTQDFTVEQIIYEDSYNAEGWTFEQYNYGSGRLIVNSDPNNHLRFFIGGTAITANAPIPLGEYLHIVCKRSGNIGYIYYNGELVASGTISSNPIDDYTAAIGGSQVFSSGKQFTGSIPLTKVYNRPLSEDEIKTNFNSLKNRFDL